MLSLVDLSSVFWPNWFKTLSGIRAYELTLEKLEWFRRDNSRVVVCADGASYIRKQWCDTYKANREKKPQDAVDALTSVINRIRSWGVPVVQCNGYEGEDCVAALVVQAWPEECQILGLDKDLYALISDTCWLTGKSGRIDSNACFEKWGVVPSQMRDFLALVGDASDNIEGCPSCGPGRAADLLDNFGSIPGILAATDEQILSVKGVGKKTLEALRSWNPDMAVKLVTLMTDAPVELEDLIT